MDFSQNTTNSQALNVFFVSLLLFTLFFYKRQMTGFAMKLRLQINQAYNPSYLALDH
jgi:hypothetical protein